MATVFIHSRRYATLALFCLGRVCLLASILMSAADRAGAQATASVTNLHNFTATVFAAANYTNSDGASPQGNLVLGSDGNFYGTTSRAGMNGNGTIFRITPAGTFTTLYTFQGYDPVTFIDPDGAFPQCTLIQGQDKKFYGTTNNGGGTADYGTVFSVTAAMATAVASSLS